MEYKFSCKIQFNSLLIVVERKDREKQSRYTARRHYLSLSMASNKPYSGKIRVQNKLISMKGNVHPIIIIIIIRWIIRFCLYVRHFHSNCPEIAILQQLPHIYNKKGFVVCLRLTPSYYYCLFAKIRYKRSRRRRRYKNTKKTFLSSSSPLDKK